MTTARYEGAESSRLGGGPEILWSSGDNFEWSALHRRGAGPIVVWLAHLEGTPRIADRVVRQLGSAGFEVLALLPPVQVPVGDTDVVELLAERIRESRAAIRWEAETSGGRCIVVAGLSLGGIAAVTASALEPTVDATGVMLAGAGLDELLGALGAVDERFAASGEIRAARDDPRLRILEPADWASRLEPASVLFARALFDGVIERGSSDRLWEALGRPRRVSYPSGHESFGWFLPWALDELGDHVRRRCDSRTQRAQR
jgi:hypothetical protein